MKAARRQQIRELLETKPFISLKELGELFPEVTGMTLRRDIEYFEQQGELIKVRNGARSMKFITATADEKYSRRERENEAVKRTLALCARGYIEKGKCIFLDSGSTAMQLASVMEDEVVNVVTSGPNISLRLIEKKKPIVTLLGGILNRDSLSVTGDLSIASLESFSIDTAFIVPSGYSSCDGFTCGNYSECELKRAVAASAKRVVLIMDSSKNEKRYPYTFCDLSDIDVFITDSDSPAARRAQKQGVTVVITGNTVLREHVTKCIPIEV